MSARMQETQFRISSMPPDTLGGNFRLYHFLLFRFAQSKKAYKKSLIEWTCSRYEFEKGAVIQLMAVVETLKPLEYSFDDNLAFETVAEGKCK